MLKCLNLDPLALRRELYCLKTLFDITDRFKYMDKALLPIRQRTINIKYKLIYAKLKVYENSFFPYTIRLWNSLSNKITNITDRDVFKMALTKFSYYILYLCLIHISFFLLHPIGLTRLSEVYWNFSCCSTSL